MKYAIVIVGLILLTALIVYNSFEEYSIKEGESFGINIGDSKEETYRNLSSFLSNFKGRNDKIFVSVEVFGKDIDYLATRPGFKILVEPMFHENGINYYKTKDSWTFFINASSLNFVELRFCNGKLCEIYRNKRPIELP